MHQLELRTEETPAAPVVVVQETTADVHALVRRLGSRKRAEREAAEAELRSLGQPAIEELLGVVRAESEKKGCQSRRLRRMFAGAVGVVIAFLVAGTFIAKSRGHHLGGDWWVILNSFSSFGAVTAVSMSGLQKSATSILAAFDDVRAVGPLTDALASQDRKLQADAVKALTRLLPRLGPEDGELLNAEQRKILARRLSGALGVRRGTDEFRIAILHAFEQFGGEDVKESVRDRCDERESSAVRAAARACMRAILERQSNEKAAHTLLRAAEAPASDAGVLLRPAQDTTAPNPLLLLRPGEKPAD